MSQHTQQMPLASMTQVKYFSTETVEAAWLRPRMKYSHDNIDILPPVVYYKLGYNGNCYFEKTMIQ